MECARTGQVYWAAALSPPHIARFMSYLNVVFTLGAWFSWVSGTGLVCAQAAIGLAKVAVESFVIHDWHIYLVYVGVLAFATVSNIHLFKLYTLSMKVLMVFINVLSIIIIVAPLVLTQRKQTPKQVFVDINNVTGWSSNGFVFLLNFLPVVSLVSGFDAATHISEEIPNPGQNVPKVMFWTPVLGWTVGFAVAIAINFCISNAANMLTPVAGQAFLQLMVDSLRHKGLVLFIQAGIVVILLWSCAGTMTTSSRMWYAFAKENGVPRSNSTSRVSLRWLVPTRAIWLTTALAVLIGLLQLGAAIALNAINGSASACFCLSYGMVIALRIRDRFSATPHSSSHFNLGRFGLAINVISLVWCFLLFTVLLFPLYLPVSASNMNYTCAVLGGIGLLALVNWVGHAKEHYTTPQAMIF